MFYERPDPSIILIALLVVIFILAFMVPLSRADDRVETLIPHIETIELLDWFSDEAAQYIDKTEGIWQRGTNAIVVDVETGIFFTASRNGGWNHADWEPASKGDTEKLRVVYGGEWSWNRRSVVVVIDGKAFAGSINGMPHGGNRIKDNGYGGHSCLHFLHSRLHVYDKEDEKHQAAVDMALGVNVDELNARIEMYWEVSNESSTASSDEQATAK